MTTDPHAPAAGKPFLALRLTPEQAHHVWTQSAEATAFTRPSHLDRLVDEVDWWGVERAGKLLAAWPLVRASRGGDIQPPPFCYYLGPMFIRGLRDDRNRARAWNSYTECLKTLIDVLVQTYPKFSFSFPPGLDDVRVLSWWNHDHPDKHGFLITPRYTARIDLSLYPDAAALQRSFASTRRQRITRWAANPPVQFDDVSTERLIELHDQTLRRSGGAITPDRHRALTRMIQLIRSGAGKIIGLAPATPQPVQAVAVLLDGPDTSNNIFFAASDAHATTGLATWALWQGMRRAQSLGHRWFDMNGANSPRRAVDKHLYGAGTELYFDCEFSG